MRIKIQLITRIFLLFLCFNSFTCAAQTLPMFIKQDREAKQVLLVTSAWLFYTFKKNKDLIDIALCNMLTISLACSLILSLYEKNCGLHAKDNEIKKQKNANTYYDDINNQIINELKQSIELQRNIIHEHNDINAVLKQCVESKDKMIYDMEEQNELLKKRLENCLKPILL